MAAVPVAVFPVGHYAPPAHLRSVVLVARRAMLSAVRTAPLLVVAVVVLVLARNPALVLVVRFVFGGLRDGKVRSYQ